MSREEKSYRPFCCKVILTIFFQVSLTSEIRYKSFADLNSICATRPLPKGKIKSEVKKMEKGVSLAYEFKRYYLAEFEIFDGDEYVTFNIVGIDVAKNEITVAVTDRGKISVITYELMEDEDGDLYFEYGVMFKKIYIDDFTEAA